MLDDKTSRMLAIILGARAFPHAPKLAGGRAFLNSAIDMEEYLTDEHGLGLSPRNILSLFDDSRSPSEQLIEVARFLEVKTQDLKNQGSRAEDLLIYYVGHGLFTRGDAAYCLAIRCTNEIDEGATSIRAGQLAGIIMRNAAFMRRYLILDCCFAASIHKEFQSGALSAARVQIEKEFPAKLGTALLCSSSAREVSLAPQGLSHTMFSSALIRALRNGHEAYGPRFSFSQLGDLTNEVLRNAYPDSYVRPEVHSPDQREGDIAVNPIFPNPAFRQRVGQQHAAPEAEPTLEKRETKETEQCAGAEQHNDRHGRPRADSDWKPQIEYSAQKTQQEGQATNPHDIQRWRRLAILTSSGLAVAVLGVVLYWIPHKSPAVSTITNEPATTQPQSAENHAPEFGGGAKKEGSAATTSQVLSPNSPALKSDNGRKRRSDTSEAATSQPATNQPLSTGNLTSTSGGMTKNQPAAPPQPRSSENLMSKLGSWTSQHSETEAWLSSLAFATSQSGWAVGWSPPTILHSEDGGGSWTEQNVGTGVTFSSIVFATPQSGWMVGQGGTILHTEDGGRNWTNQNSGTGAGLFSATFVTSQLGWSVGGGGTILHTTDGGRNWTKQNSGTEAKLTSVSFPTRQSGWVAGDDGTILHTEDGGNSWTKQSTGIGDLLWSVAFASTQLGWAVGQNGVLLHTEDGGHIWTKQNSGTGKELHSIAFATARSGLAVGEGGTILHTEDGGETWTKEISGTSTELFAVFFTPQSCWVVGRDGIILHWK
jgi:photosystem II stability/assembly factor-like uncharacterized protein